MLQEWVYPPWGFITSPKSCKFLSIVLVHAGTACFVHGQEMHQHTEISIYFDLKSQCITCPFIRTQSTCGILVCNPWRLFSLKSPLCCVSGLRHSTFPPKMSSILLPFLPKMSSIAQCRGCLGMSMGGGWCAWPSPFSCALLGPH